MFLYWFICIPEFSSDSTTLIISSISSIEMKKLNHFSALATTFPLIFLSNLFNTVDVALVASLCKTFLAKGKARSNNTFFA